MVSYGTGGYAWADTDSVGDDDGYFVGAGYEHLITDNFSLGAEALYHEFGDFGTDGDDFSLDDRSGTRHVPLLIALI